MRSFLAFTLSLSLALPAASQTLLSEEAVGFEALNASDWNFRLAFGRGYCLQG